MWRRDKQGKKLSFKEDMARRRGLIKAEKEARADRRFKQQADAAEAKYQAQYGEASDA